MDKPSKGSVMLFALLLMSLVMSLIFSGMDLVGSQQKWLNQRKQARDSDYQMLSSLRPAFSALYSGKSLSCLNDRDGLSGFWAKEYQHCRWCGAWAVFDLGFDCCQRVDQARVAHFYGVAIRDTQNHQSLWSVLALSHQLPSCICEGTMTYVKTGMQVLVVR